MEKEKAIYTREKKRKTNININTHSKSNCTKFTKIHHPHKKSSHPSAFNYKKTDSVIHSNNTLVSVSSVP